MKRIFLFFVIVFVVVGLILLASGLYFKFMPDKNYNNVKADYTLTATALFNDFDGNENKANQKYMDRVVEVSGTIAEISEDQKGDMVIALRDTDAFAGILCTLEENQKKMLQNYKVGKPITLRGVCTGMLMDVVLNKCAIINQADN